MDTRLERAIARASDLEDKLARREKEIARLREAHSGEEADLQELEQRALDAEQERAALEEELGDLTVRVARITKQLDGQEPEAVLDHRAQERAGGRVAGEFRLVDEIEGVDDGVATLLRLTTRLVVGAVVLNEQSRVVTTR